MKKLMMKITAILFIAFMMFLQVPAKAVNVDVLPTMTSESVAANRVWVGTFQLVWNELTDSVLKHSVEFVDYESPMAELLNKKEFTKSNIDSEAYYTKYGVVSPKLKKTIAGSIRRKFNETSDILDSFDWSYAPNKYLLYAMLKKDFKFLKPFDKLPAGTFGRNPKEVDYFGINGSSKRALFDNVQVLFYNSPSDFAVKLKTQGKDDVILYRTNDDCTFDKYYDEILVKAQAYSGNQIFQYSDTLTIPDVNMFLETSFSELEGQEIKNSDFIIDKTIETIDFKMNNEGVKLKSEAAMMMRFALVVPDRMRNFNFTDTFVLFLVEKKQNVPYYAMRVADVAELNKTGRK